MNISIIVPVFNEEKVIESTISQIKAAFNESGIRYEIIVVNDGSTDSSGEILRKIRGIQLLENKSNKGYGFSLKKGISVSKYDKIAIIDADNTYPIKDLVGLVRRSKDFDMVIGARTGHVVQDNPLKQFTKWFLNVFASFLAGSSIPDINSGMRVFRKDVTLKYWNLFPDRFSFTSTLTMIFLTNSYSVKFQPISYFKRIGKSSISPIKDTINFFTTVFKLALYFNPLKIFVPLAILFVILGIVRGIRDYLIDNRLGILALILVNIGIQTFFFGLIAEMIDKIGRLK